MEATLGRNKRIRGQHPNWPVLPPHPPYLSRRPSGTHTDSSACFLASAACCSRSFSATWACRSISLKLWLLTFWAPRPFLAPSWEENHVMGAWPTTVSSTLSQARVLSDSQRNVFLLKVQGKKNRRPVVWLTGRTGALLELGTRLLTQPQQRPQGLATATSVGGAQHDPGTLGAQSLIPPRVP